MKAGMTLEELGSGWYFYKHAWCIIKSMLWNEQFTFTEIFKHTQIRIRRLNGMSVTTAQNIVRVRCNSCWFAYTGRCKEVLWW